MPPPLPEKLSSPEGVWWEDFHDPALNSLVGKALADNQGLKQAYARLKQAWAVADQARASRWPSVTTDAGAGRSRINVETQTGSKALYNTQYSAGAGVSYEVDLWGRIASLTRAAELDAGASQEDLETIGMSLAAEVSETWFSVVEQNAMLRLAQEQLDVSQTYLKLIQVRFGQGQSSALDVYQQRQQAAGIRAQLPLIESKRRVSLHKLAVLLGQSPQEEPELAGKTDLNRVVLPELHDLPSAGIPADILKSRPDIQAARFRVKAADHRVSAAISDRFPSLRLTASGGFRATELARLFENLIWDILGNLSGTLWDGGRKSAEIRRTRAVLEERTAAYVQAVLTACQETEDALVREEHQRTYIDKLEAQISFARVSLEESRAHYLNGLDDYLRVLTALKSVQELEKALISAKKQLLSYRVQLYRALGGKRITEKRLSGVPSS
ncbi:efflux transporter outer membrane subunit [Desulfococcaceae bacterium HSG8]|nr:efflux transporter outer membrane subunit [Desulfococcaceae bacterium HSG8]